MKTTMILLRCLPMILALAMVAGCSGLSGSPTVDVQDLGLKMELPPGWRMERDNPRMMADAGNPDNHFGLIEDFPAEGKSLDQHVEEMTRMDAAAVRSRQPKTIGGYPAVELVSEAQFSVLEVIIQKDDRIIRVSFRVEKEALPIQGAALRQALESIRFP